MDRGSQGDIAVRAAPVKRAKWHLGKEIGIMHLKIYFFAEISIEKSNAFIFLMNLISLQEYDHRANQTI